MDDKKTNSMKNIPWKGSLEDKFRYYIEEICNGKQSTIEARYLNRLFIAIYKDPEFNSLKKYNCTRQILADAQSKMWEYLLSNLCEPSQYTKDGKSFLQRAQDKNVVFTLKNSLKNQIKTIHAKNQIERKRRVERKDKRGQPIDATENLVNNSEGENQEQFDKELLRLLKEDPLGELTSEKNTRRGRKKLYLITAQDYLIERCIKLQPRQKIARKYGVPDGTINDSQLTGPWEALLEKYIEMAKNNLL